MSAGDSFVATRAIQAAVKGREHEVLDALGIEWQKGRPHINCPYPDHDDERPSWRWDAQKVRAHCTCIAGSDSVFDVAMKIRKCVFESAKLFVAEVIGRNDLILKPKGGVVGYVAMDAESLLKPPDAVRDDGLVFAYLAARLGIPVQGLVAPRTAFAGWASLPYFDPPPSNRRNSKPKYIGDYPCAVFETVDAGGRRHAHRIYLAAGGAGKAELGCDSSGSLRNPKKSARALEGDRTIGRAVIWGDPSAAEWIILCEGIETGAALAFAFASEIGTSTVAAAISAGGVEAFVAYPNTRRVTVAADRDEAPKDDGDAGTRRGEKAARRFALHHFETLEVTISLPGEPGEKVDFLDILRRDGANALRNAINAAAPFYPTTTEREDLARGRERKTELAEVAKLFPVPHLDNLELAYQHTRSGHIMVHKVTRMRGTESSTSETALTALASPFGVPARLRYVDQGDAYGLRAVVQDMNGNRRTIDIDRAMLAKWRAPEVLSSLYAAGLRTEADGEAVVLQCLKAAAPDQEIIVLHRPGWHELPGYADPVFVSPDGTTFGTPDGYELELAAKARIAPEHAASVDLQGWKTAIGAALSAHGCPHWTIGTAAGFAGVVASLAAIDTWGINLSGLSTSGKTIAQRLAVSAWSTPDIRKPGLFQSARSTVNAAEAFAHRATGTILAMDELSHLPGKELAQLIYTVAGGVGKGRMNADSTIRSTYNWSTFALLSSESSLAEKIVRDGGQWTAGMAVRFPDIDVTDVNRQVDAETLNRIEGINQHYGHAGRAFVRELFEAGLHRRPLEVRERIMQIARNLAGEASDSGTIRAAMPFAILIVAGEMAKAFRVLPESEETMPAVLWAWATFRQSLDSLALDPKEQAIANIREFVAAWWNVTIRFIGHEGNTHSRQAEGWYDDDAVYLPRVTLLKAAGGTLKESQISKTLAVRRLLARSDTNRHTVQWIPGFKRVRAYALKRSEFGRVEGRPDSPASDDD